MRYLAMHGFDLTSFLLTLAILIIVVAVVLVCLSAPIILYFRGVYARRSGGEGGGRAKKGG
jgi:hypothetical protein